METYKLAHAEKLIAYIRAELDLAVTYAEDGASDTALEVIRRTIRKIEEFEQ